MWILNLLLVFVFVAGGFAGNRSWFTFDKLTKTNVLNSTLFILSVFTVMMVLYVLGFFPQSVAAPTMMAIYSLIGGFFTGYACRLFWLRKDSLHLLYQHRSFWIDHAPNLLAVVIILYGIFRTAILTDQPVTGIRLTSGISLICFGIFTWTLKAVPEFRSKGVLLLDRFIPWEQVIAWSWQSESVLEIEYFAEDAPKDERIRHFVTSIPEDERKEIEIILSSRMDEFSDERQKRLFKED